MTALPVFRLLGVNISAVNLDTALTAIKDMVARRCKGYVCVAPVSTIVDAKRDPAYRAVVNAAAMVTPDGMPVALIGRHKAGAQVGRTYGPDLMLKACDEGRAYGFRHFFYGGTQAVCDKLVNSLEARFPGISVAGRIAPPFMVKAGVAAKDVVDAINAARPDILWVGLGSPKQDFWMALNREGLEVPVMVGVGAAFDFLAGSKPKAPRWMQVLCLEWLFRLICEPRRLWKRYLVGNFLFIYWVIKESLFGEQGS
jgi:N-acetylglucosaminyldiphosphoundecaprenol N-acetyl-beta-D-mannosaminyltransferase